MNILIAGGSGFIGQYIKKRFIENGFAVRVVSRDGVDVSWNETELTHELESTDVLINLAGKSINSRFTQKNKQAIMQSRIKTTRLLNKAVSACTDPPVLWINASATGIYKHTDENECLTEQSRDYAVDFLGDVVQQWEREFFNTSIPQVRKAALRTSVVLGNSGGAFPLFKLLTVTGLGGKQGNGKQMVSWIHVEDYFQIILFLINNTEISGIVNAAAPNPVSNEHFMKTLRKARRVLFGIPAPAWIIRMATFVVGVDASLILGSTHVASEVLKKNGFEFQFPTPDIAFRDLIQ